jgi:tetratricopeptide (TPR) repeat protein
MTATDEPDFRTRADRALGLHRSGNLAGAEAEYRAALAIAPDTRAVLHNLGVLLAERGETEEALAILDRLVALQPSYASAHFNRATALRAAGRDEEALAAFRTVVALEPDHIDAHRALGFLWLAARKPGRALDHFARTYELRRGDDRTGTATRSLRTATREKLEHDAALFRHLPQRARDRNRFVTMARAYESVANELGDGIAELTEAQLEILGDGYNGPINLAEAPELPGGAVSPDLDAGRIIRDFRNTTPGVARVDRLLTPRALTLLRRHLLESTIWHDFAHIPGFVASYLEDGLACPLVLQIADEFRAALPDLLGPHPLTQAWAFKGLRGTEPIDLHADDAAISLNFWVTPDSANRAPDRGGLAIYAVPPPAGWELVDYDADRARIRTFLAGHEDRKLTIPYGENCGVLFESRLFHGSDSPDFAEGYENRRINITMLFGTAKQM